LKVGLKDLLTDEVLREIGSRYDLELSSIKEIDTFENFIYEAKRLDKSVILRISHSSYRDINQIQAEIDWIDFLKQKGMPVVQPLKSKSNIFVEEIKLKDSSFYTTLFEKIEGESGEKNRSLLTSDIIHKWGSILGRMHVLTKAYQPNPQYMRKQWDEQPEIVNIDEILADYPIILDKSQKLIKEIQSLPKDENSFGLVHYDLHESNIIIDGENITAIDFDDSLYDWFASDIAVIFFQVAWRFFSKDKSREEVIDEIYPIFMKGYLQTHQIDEFWINKIPDFLKLRHITLFCTLIIEQKIEYDDWAQKIIDWWVPMLEQDTPWINFDFSLNL
jgi:Ser/Thr protein kinase RdoA (MazF antagonist)